LPDLADAPVAELVDALDSKSSSARSAGSIPARGTRLKEPAITITYIISSIPDFFRGALKTHIKLRGSKSEFECIFEYISGRVLTAAVRFVGIFVGIGGTNVHDEFRYSRTREASTPALN
jgi:hypothetical protein